MVWRIQNVDKTIISNFRHFRLGRENIVELLLRNGALIDHKNNDGWTALMTAAFNGQKNIVQLLIKARADVHAKDPIKRTPIYLAARNGKNIA